MPFESSLPLVVTCVLGGLITVALWTRAQTLWLSGVAAIFLLAALGVFVADRLVMTDREYLHDLFLRLAVAAEQQDTATILAAIDPDLRPLRHEAEQVLKRVKPTQILLTFLEVTVDTAQIPPQATADVVVRVAGNVIDAGTLGNVLAEFRVLLHKKGGTWLIKHVEADQTRLGQLR
jgi:hypothetical protein